MAFAASVTWEARSDGNDANGGGFDAVSGTPGTDYSQQAAAQVAYTDIVIDGTTNTNCTSAATPFTSAHVGNIINITAGTGFTVQRVQIMSVAAGVATCDKSLGTLSSTGGTGNLGGAVARPDTVDPITVAGNVGFIRSGTYTHTTTMTMSADGAVVGGMIAWIGYDAAGSRADVAIAESLMPVFTSATNSVALITLNGATRLRLRNIKFTHTAGTRGIGIATVTAANVNCVFENIVCDGCLTGISDAGFAMQGCEFRNVTVRNSTSHGFNLANASSNTNTLWYCWANANAGNGFRMQRTSCKFFHCISSNNTGASGHGWQDVTTTTAQTSHSSWSWCVAYNNAQSGIRMDFTTGGFGLLSFDNCIFYGNGVYGISCATAGLIDGRTGPRVRKCAFGNNTTGDRQNFRTGEDDITLTFTPFANAGSGDFSLNNTSGGGILLRGLGWPTTVGAMGSSTDNYTDVGAAGTNAGAAASSVGVANVRGNMQ